MKNKGKENLSKALEKSSQLSDLLNLIVENKCTYDTEINDDPLINLCRDLALTVTNKLFEEVENGK